MALRTTDSLLGSPRVTDAHIASLIRALDGPTADDQIFINRLRYWCGIAGVDDANAISQALWETGNLTSIRYTRDRNPVGLGIVGDGTIQPFDIKDYDEAARVTVQAIYSMVKKQWHPGVPMPAGAVSWMNGVWLPKVRHPLYPANVTHVNDQHIIYYIDGDMKATWAADAGYLSHTDRFNRMVPGVPDQFTLPVEEPDMALPAAPPLRISIMPYGNANRPKLEMASPSYITVHEVGNTSPGADEEMHRQFVHNGGGSSQVSFQFVVGPTEAIQLMPIDEAAWHASDGYSGTGNRDSIAIETIQIGNFDKTLWNLAWLINELATNPNRFYHNQPRQWDLSIEKIKQHHDWAPDGKNCPQFIRDRGLWPELMRRVDAWNAASTPAPPPDPKPDPEPEPTPEPAKHTLPKGMSVQLASRLFGAYAAPWDDTLFRFDLEQAPSQVWLARGVRSIPKGKTWADGTWPELNVVVRRGNGDQVWVWSDGSTYERKP